jgi:hypothetical protein
MTSRYPNFTKVRSSFSIASRNHLVYDEIRWLIGHNVLMVNEAWGSKDQRLI